MNISSESLIKVLPVWLRNEISASQFTSILEIRLRIGQAVELRTMQGTHWVDRKVNESDLRFCVNVASKYSPWITSSIYQGFITLEGGHRIGISGSWTIDDSGRRSIQNLTSLCFRISKDFHNISGDLHKYNGSVLIIGRPGSGKTTLLRDLIRKKSNNHDGTVCVVDERKELFPLIGEKMCFQPGRRTDILSGCPKRKGIEIAIRCMGPKVIAVDEITAAEDCTALMEAGWCGVDILATAHASCKEDLLRRPVYKPLLDYNLFQGLVVMNQDKSWYFERMD